MSDSEEDEKAEKQYKIIIIGDPETGKSSLVSKYTKDKFSKQYKPTTGVEFYLKRTIVTGGKYITLKLWDIEGTALKGKMLDNYIYGANALIFLYDVTNAESINNLEKWVSACRKKLTKEPPVFALVANKIDLEHLRKVKSDRHHKFAQENQLSTFAVSSKTGEGVNLCFQKISAELLGIKLSKAEQEQHQPVFKAEIVSYPDDKLPAPPQSNFKTTVCCIQ
uniref:Ras-related protein Rab-28 n=2 Tax=Lepeophtheirus salmonis TaxID=72036 RepID=A0A0K2V6Q2_LEPSM